MLNEKDQIFLDQYILYFKLICESTNDSLGGIYGINHEILYKPSFATLIGVDDQEFITNSQKPEMVSLRKKALQERKLTKYLIMGKLLNDLPRFFLLSYAPIINPETKNIVGLYANPKYLEMFNIWVLLSKYYNKEIIEPNRIICNIELTGRETQVIFFFLLNLDSNTIAGIISKIEHKSLSKGAIDQVFQTQLMPKFKVYGRKALKDKLIDLGYHRVIPKNILKDGFAIDITNYVYNQH